MTNENALFHNDSRYIISGTINGFSAEIKKVKTHMDKIPSKGESFVFNRLSLRKHVISDVVRHHLLAYAFLKGNPYLKVEKKYAQGNAPRAEYLFKIIKEHAPNYIWYQRESSPKKLSFGSKLYSVTLEDVKAWLAPKEEEIKENVAV